MTEAITLHQQQSDPLAYLTDSAAFEHIWRVAKAFSGSRMVPQHFQGKPEDTFVAIQMALQLDVNPLLCLQNMQVINGRPGFSASFAIGLANRRGPFLGPLTWSQTGEGDDLEVTCSATIEATGEVVSVSVSMAMAKAEGWTKNPKYRTMPAQMLRYRSATWLIRLYCPEVTCGLPATDELAQVQPVRVRPEPQTSNTVEMLNQQITAAVAVAPVADEQPQEVEIVSDSPGDPNDMF